MRFAYADPPYPGQAARNYGGTWKSRPKRDVAHVAEVNHPLLVAHLEADFDAWAMSTSSSSLQYVLSICPPDVRVGAWVKPFASFKPGVNPGYAWEPVVFKGGRKIGREVPTVRDFVSANITLRRGVSGAKPYEFCAWLFSLMGAQDGDDLIDLFPGSGAVGGAWERWRRSGQAELFAMELDR